MVLEKPFGRDLESATELASAITESLKEEEIFRVDHYLGKPGVQQIEPFLVANQAELVKHSLASIDIAMFETEDCKYVCHLVTMHIAHFMFLFCFV